METPYIIVVDKTIKLRDITYSDWRTKNSKMNNDVEHIINDILKDLDCSKLINNEQLLTTKDFRYNNLMCEFLYFILKLVDYIKYNNYIDKLIKIHNDNIYFENTLKENVMPLKQGKINKNNNGNSAKRNWVKYETTDMINGTKSYMYVNTRTNEKLIREDPNLLAELNATKKTKSNIKVKRKKVEQFNHTIKPKLVLKL